MKLTDYQTKQAEYGTDQTPGITLTTTAEKIWFDKITKQPSFTIPKGSKVEVDFSTKFNSKIFVTIGDEVRIASITNAHKWLPKFNKVPSERVLSTYVDSGIAKTVLGNKTEPDGHDSFGAPSWLLVLGLI